MNGAEELRSLFNLYLKRFPGEAEEMTRFRDFIDKFDGARLFDRKNFTGHITVSAIITDRDMRKFLLLEHRGLKKWLQPGGHVEPSDAGLLAGAFREVEEETGLRRRDYDVMALPGGLNVIDFDSHHIPPSDAKREGEHYHHDVRFLFRLREETPVVPDPAESGGYKWVTREEFHCYSDITRVMPKLDLFTEIFTE